MQGGEFLDQQSDRWSLTTNICYNLESGSLNTSGKLTRNCA